jgi:hypothetical protein
MDSGNIRIGMIGALWYVWYQTRDGSFKQREKFTKESRARTPGRENAD